MPFTKGDKNINRSGRPKKGQSLTDILNFELDNKDDTGTLKRQRIAQKLIELADGGDIGAIKYLIDRIDGTATQRINVSGGSIDLEARAAEAERIAKERYESRHAADTGK